MRSEKRSGKPHDSVAPVIEDPEPQPPQIPIGDAADTPVRSGKPSRLRRLADIGVIVLAPIVISIVLLAAMRTHTNEEFWTKISFGEIAIALTSVAIAAVARAWDSHSEPWQVMSFAALIVGAVQACFVSAFDNYNLVEKLVKAATHCPNDCKNAELGSLAADVQSNYPGVFPWFICLSSGAFLIAMVIYTIWKES